MVRLASLAIAQHVFQPALTGRPESGPELISRKIVSREREQRLYRGEQISRKKVSHKLGPTSYRDFAKNIALMGTKKWGPTCDCDISNSAIYTTAIYRAYTVMAWALAVVASSMSLTASLVTTNRMQQCSIYVHTGTCIYKVFSVLVSLILYSVGNKSYMYITSTTTVQLPHDQ